MRKVNLTGAGKTALESRHKQAHNGRERDRIKAVLLSSEGWSISMIAQALRLHETSILRHLDEYQRAHKLQLSSGGSKSYLNEEQKLELVAHLSEHTYAHVYEIAAYIQQRWSINYSIAGLNKWLHQHRFSYKKPKEVPHKADTARQAEFIEAYEALKAGV